MIRISDVLNPEFINAIEFEEQPYFIKFKLLRYWHHHHMQTSQPIHHHLLPPRPPPSRTRGAGPTPRRPNPRGCPRTRRG